MINFADTGFILVCAAMVCLMTPALAVFYAGLLRKGNIVDIMFQCFIAMGIVTVLWFMGGFSLIFGDDVSGIIGNLEFAFLQNVSLAPSALWAPTIPFIAFFVFQLMFALVTPALICGAVAERMTLKSYMVFLTLWSLLVYIPVAHWVWGGGFLSQMGLADFAGGTVVHMSAGFSALAAVLVIGGRKKRDYTPHNMVYVAIGAGLLWFGWFAFNGGSALAANEIAAMTITNSQISAGFGLMTWIIASWIQEKHPSVLSAMMGALAGLVCITPGSGFVEPWAAAIIGVAGTLCCYGMIQLRIKKNLDDTLDVFGLHGVGGTVGIIMTGIFASPAINAVTGAVYGNPGQMLTQLAGAVIVMLYGFVLTIVMLKIISCFTPLRISEQLESVGIDEAYYQEKGMVE